MFVYEYIIVFGMFAISSITYVAIMDYSSGLSPTTAALIMSEAHNIVAYDGNVLK